MIRTTCIAFGVLALSACMSAAPQAAAPEDPPADTPHLAAMARLSPLIGAFTVTGVRHEAGGPVELTPTAARAEVILEGYGLQETSQSDMGGNVPVTLLTTFSYDPYRKVYRVTALDDTFGVMDVYEGRFVSEHVLSVTNLRSDTHFPVGEDGARLHFQLRWDLAAEPKRFDVLMTRDGGANWSPYYEMRYTASDE